MRHEFPSQRQMRLKCHRPQRCEDDPSLRWCFSDLTEDRNGRRAATAARSVSHKAHTPTSPRLSNSISQWGADATEMNCGVCKVKFSWATNVGEIHVAASGSHLVFRRWRAGTHPLLSSLTGARHFWTVTEKKTKLNNLMWKIRPVCHQVKAKMDKLKLEFDWFPGCIIGNVHCAISGWICRMQRDVYTIVYFLSTSLVFGMKSP